MKIKKIVNNKNKEREVVSFSDQERAIRNEVKDKLYEKVKFPKCVFSYIKGRSAKEAVDLAKKYINLYNCFIKCDIKEFFPSIDIDILADKLRKYTEDEELVNKIVGLVNEEADKLGVTGITLGSPLSPVLSNIYLMDFDIHFREKGIKHLRFSDDMIFFSNDNILQEIEEELSKINLTVSDDKTILGTQGDTVNFLGFDINKNGIKVEKQSIKEKEEKAAENNLELPGYYHDIKDGFDVISLINIINSKDEEKFLKNIILIDKEDFDDKTIDKLCNLIRDNMGAAFECVFKNATLKHDKNELIEKLMENGKFQDAYKFEEILSKVKFVNSEREKFREIFSGRFGEYYLSPMGDKKDYALKKGDYDNQVLNNHFKGAKSLAIRLDRHDETSKILVFDIDSTDETEALSFSKDIKKKLNKKGYTAYIEFSGKKGYHVWVFFKSFIKVKTLNDLAEEVIDNMISSKTKIEIIPNAKAITDTQNVIKLPLGFHPETKKQCIFIDIDDFNEIRFNEDVLLELEEETGFTEGIKETHPDAYKILSKCNIMRHLVELGVKKHSMNHFERLLIMYVFIHIDKGSNFIHHVMEHMSNYSYNITEKFINKAPDMPVSCNKVRDYFKDYEIGDDCNCKFKLHDGIYPSPVIHADIKAFSKMSIEANIGNVLNDIIKLKSQKEDIDKKIIHNQKKLDSLFDALGDESIKIEMGELRRLKSGNDTKWVIEISI